MNTSELFKREINFIKSRHLQNIVINTLNASPKCLQIIPSSSTKKYHPEYAVVDGKILEDGTIIEGGLVRHIKATVGFAYALIESSVLEGMLKAEESRRDYNSNIEDVVYASLIMHDCCKARDDDELHTTQFAHPLLAATLFKNTANKYVEENKESICDEDMIHLKEMISLIERCVMSHMGKYNTSKYEKDVVLLKPTTTLEWFVHQCDLLSSKKYLNFDFGEYLATIK